MHTMVGQPPPAASTSDLNRCHRTMATARQFSTNEAWNDYCNWLIANGAFIHEALVFPPYSKQARVFSGGAGWPLGIPSLRHPFPRADFY